MKVPHKQNPVVQRIRIRYAKRGRLRFTSHRDFARAFERALRRSGIPIAYSSGFSPHPKISYMGAAPTGMASEAEYLEIGLQAEMDAVEVGQRLDAALPAGLDIVESSPVDGVDLAAWLTASLWMIEISGDYTEIEPEIRSFLESTERIITRKGKDGERRIDVRPAVVSLVIDPRPSEQVILRAVVSHGTPTVRPDDLLAALRIEGLASRSTRLAQGPLDELAGVAADPIGQK